MRKYEWSALNKLQLGKYAEYFVKMEFTQYGFDVYSSEVDDRGIDFVVRKEPSKYYDIQVKSIRERGYVFFPKTTFEPRENLFAALIIFVENQEPQLFLIPSLSWKTPDKLLKEYEYVGKQSKPEWGLNLSKRNVPLLQKFNFDTIIQDL